MEIFVTLNTGQVAVWTISAQVAELEALETEIVSEDKAAAGGSGTKATSTLVKPLVKIVPAADVSAVQAPEAVPNVVIGKAAVHEEAAETSDYEDFGSVTEDEDVGAMDQSGFKIMG
jgi:hypothetical protein